MNKLQEAIKTFDIWVSGSRRVAAEREYAEAALTQDGQKQILQDAQNGSTTAADFIFVTLKAVIAKAFWKYYLGPNTATHQHKISSGADQDFASLAYSMLLGQADPSPYDTFNPKKFTKSANLIKQFGYYVYRYLENEATKIHRAENMGGMTGNVKSDSGGVNVTSYEGIADVREDGTQAANQPSVSDSFTSDIDERETIRVFLEHLQQLRPIYRDVFYYRLKGLSVDQVAAKLKISDQSVRNHMKAIQGLYKEFIGE